MQDHSLTDDQSRRYLRQTLLADFGKEGQARLLGSKVLIIGAGGLGCPAASYLAGAGVGTIGLVDFDRVELSNLPRQTLFEQADIGRLKVDAAKDRLSELNSDIKIEAIAETISETNAREIIQGYDLVMDGCDNFETRFAVADACAALHIPLISGAISGWGGQLAAFAPYKGEDYPCYRCLTPPQAEGGSCQREGVLGASTGVIGSLMAQEAMKYLAGIETIEKTLLVYDAKTLTFQKLALLKNASCKHHHRKAA